MLVKAHSTLPGVCRYRAYRAAGTGDWVARPFNKCGGNDAESAVNKVSEDGSQAQSGWEDDRHIRQSSAPPAVGVHDTDAAGMVLASQAATQAIRYALMCEQLGHIEQAAYHFAGQVQQHL